MADCTPPKGILPPSAPVLVGIMDHVAALAQRGKVMVIIVRRVVVEMRTSKNDAGR
jgi:hypothetical protein